MELIYRFAKTGDELAKEILDAVDAFQEYTIRTGKATIWLKNQDYNEGKYYESYEGEDIIDVGEQGEMKATVFNHFRSVATQMENQVTSDTPAYQVTALNTDMQSRKDTSMGKRLVDYYHKVKRVELDLNETLHKGIIHGDSAVIVEWNPLLGEKKASLNGEIRFTGDFEPRSKSVWDLFWDHHLETKKNLPWSIFRDRINKYDLAAKFPAFAEQILALQSYKQTDRYYSYMNRISFDEDTDDDNVYVYSFYHIVSPTLKDGKMAIVVGDSKSNAILLYEDKNFYRKRLPLFFIEPATYMCDSFGYTNLSMARSPQELMNIVISTLATNAIAAGGQNIYAGPSGNNVDIQTTVDGMNFFYADIKPEVIDFFQQNPALQETLNYCQSTIETLTGINSVVRGNVANAPNLKSGVAIATVINLALQYSVGLAKSYYRLFEDVYTFMIDILKVTADQKRMIEIVGSANADDVSEFTKENLQGISRVIVQRTNPIMKTAAGAAEYGMNMLQLGLITPQQYFDLLNNGNIDFATQPDERMRDLIAEVKRALLAGQKCNPIPGIRHKDFMIEIQSLMLDYDMLHNPEKAPILQNVTELLQAQMMLAQDDVISSFLYPESAPTPPQAAAPGNMAKNMTPPTPGKVQQGGTKNV